MRAVDRILGIDIGATTIKYAALQGEMLGERFVQPIAASGNAALVEQLAAIVGDEQFADCQKIGIGSPGPLDIERGVIIASANMPAVRDCALVPELQTLFPMKKIRLDNDANAATLGQKYFGLGKSLGDFAVFTLGTGVGGGCIYEGRLHRGYNGNFFEVGHIPVAGLASDARICGCGNRGCLEAYASATGVSISYFEQRGEHLTAEAISRRARAGDAAAAAAYEKAAVALGLGAAGITQLMNLTQFIFTGGMAAAEDLIYPRLRETYLAHTFALFHTMAKFTFTQGDENSGIYGAAALFLE